MMPAKLICQIIPQPPGGIKYMLGAESWKPVAEQSPRRLVCEEWGNMGPLELRPDIQDNGHGFRVRVTEFAAPPEANSFTEVDGAYWWVFDEQAAAQEKS
jgi:hypothetical protein